MLGSIKDLGRGLSRAWDNLAEGWRELFDRCGTAITRFSRRDGTGASDAPRPGPEFPRWSLLAGEVIDEGKSIVVRLEVPGVDKGDLDIEVRGDTLYVRGERRLERERIGGWYYVMERAYGSFQRAIPLPLPVQADSAQASLRNGVLSVALRKRGEGGPRRLTVQ